jgi:hypothetical protein
MMSPTLHQFAFFVFVVSSHALQDTVARDHKNIMRSVKGSNAEIVTVKAHGNRSVPKKQEKLKEKLGQPKAAANRKKSFARTERKVSKDNTAKRNVRPLHHAHARRISFAGEPSPLNQNGFNVPGQPMLESKDLPSTSPTAFVIQSSGDVDVSGTDGASSSHLAPLAIIQQAPTVAPGIVTVAPGTITVAPQTVTVAPAAVTGAPAAPVPAPAPALAAPAPAPATPAGGSGFLGTFVMLLLFAGLIVGAGALFVKLRKDAKSSRAGRLGALLHEDTGDSHFWKSAKSRQSSRRSVQGTPSETEEEAMVSSKSEETERKAPRSPSAYRERRSASQSSSKAKNEGEDSEADTSNSRYKKGRSQSRIQSEGPKVERQDSVKSFEGQDSEKSQGRTSITERDPNAPTTYRGRRNQLTSSRSERTSRSQSQSGTARQQKDEQGDNVTV